jgi:hypothetical protein
MLGVPRRRNLECKVHPAVFMTLLGNFTAHILSVGVLTTACMRHVQFPCSGKPFYVIKAEVAK